MVSTDDEEIAEVAKKYGAKVPFMRSKENADDMATIADVIKEVVEFYRANGKSPEIISCLFATAPFLSVELLKDGYQKVAARRIRLRFHHTKF